MFFFIKKYPGVSQIFINDPGEENSYGLNILNPLELYFNIILTYIHVIDKISMKNIIKFVR